LTLRIREVVSALEASAIAFRAGLQLLFLAAIALFVAPKFFALAVAVLAPFAWLLGRARRRLRAVQRAELDAADRLLEAADEAVRYSDLWRSFGAGARISEHIARLGREARERSARLGLFAAAQTGANELLGVLAVAVAIASLSRWAPGDATRLAPFAVPFFLAYRPLRELADARLSLSRSGEAARALDETFALGSEAAPPADDRRPLPLRALEIRQLVHPHAAWSPLTLDVAPGTIVALVGRTGVGKTTLLRILLGLEAPAVGEIRYGGRSLDGAACGPGARPFAWVPQEAPVLAASLDENVFLAGSGSGSGTAEGRDAAELLRSLRAESLLALGDERLGLGYRPLSGGERQWLSLARALAADQPVLLLDEPTSGLDPVAEERVLATIARLRGTKTVVIVTHREAPTAIADRVIRLEDGPSYFGGGRVVCATTGLGTQRKLSSKTLEL
jgi:ABC-type transport system involved in cytochrome bd biosynthesis fused ATPase/permease subunit